MAYPLEFFHPHQGQTKHGPGDPITKIKASVRSYRLEPIRSGKHTPFDLTRHAQVLTPKVFRVESG